MKNIKIPSRIQPYELSDHCRIRSRHYNKMCELAEDGGYPTIGQLLEAILDAALPRITLVEKPRHYIAIDGYTTSNMEDDIR